MARVGLIAILVAGLAALQVLIGATPVELSPAGHRRPAARSYVLKQIGPAAARLTLFGVSSLRPNSLYLLPVTRATHVYPIGNPAQVIPSRRAGETLNIRMYADPGTYKLVLPGVEPFGLVSVGR